MNSINHLKTHLQTALGIATWAVLATAFLAPAAHAISPGGVLSRVQEAWEEVDDFTAEAVFSASNIDGQERHLWGRVRMMRPNSLRLDLYSTPKAVHSATAEADLILFTLDDMFWEYNRKEQKAWAGVQPDESLLPFVVALVGTEGFDREKFERNYYIAAHEGVPEGYDRGIPSYILQIEPKGEQKEQQPRRFIWVDKETWFPRKVEIETPQSSRTIRLVDPRTNLGLTRNDMVPLVPPGTTIECLTDDCF